MEVHTKALSGQISISGLSGVPGKGKKKKKKRRIMAAFRAEFRRSAALAFTSHIRVSCDISPRGRGFICFPIFQ